MLNNKKYIYSTAKDNLVLTWALAIIFSLFAYPVITIGFGKEDNTTGVIILLSLFPLLAALFIYFAIRDTFSWFAHGRTALLLDPAIGSIGGDIGGTIFLNKIYASDAKFKVVISNIYSYTTRKHNRSINNNSTSTHTEILWEDEGFSEVINVAGKTQLKFRFQIPEGLKESHNFANKSYYWEVKVTQVSDDSSFIRDFIIPVKVSRNTSKHINTKTTNTFPNGIKKMTAFSILPIKEYTYGYEIYYPAFFHKLGMQGLGIFGGIFFIIGFSIAIFASSELAIFIGTIFSIFGTAIILYGLYDFLMETHIYYDDTHIISKRYLLGIPMKEISLKIDDKIKILYLDFLRRPLKKNKN